MRDAGRWIVCLLVLGSGPHARAAAAPSKRTVVTLGFDDGRTTQLDALPLLAEFGMRASFFINSGNIGTPGYLDLAQLAQVQAAGHELGGHTVDHEVLTQLPLAEARHQACDDRTALEAAGLAPLVSFAYPGGASDPELQAIVESCGYRYGWGQGWIDQDDCTENCTFAEPAPPANPLHLRSPLSITRDWTLADLQGFVVRAEQQGGWLGLSFHHVCDDCNYNYRISPALLREFLAWLAPRAEQGTVVLPLADAFAPPPPIEGPPSGEAPAPDGPGLSDGPDTSAPRAGSDRAPAPSSGCSSAGTGTERRSAFGLVALWLIAHRLRTRRTRAG